MLALHLTARESTIVHRWSKVVSPFVWSAHCKIQVFYLRDTECNNRRMPPNKSSGWRFGSPSYIFQTFYGDGPECLRTSEKFKASRRHLTTCFIELLKWKWRAQLKNPCENPWTACLCSAGPLQHTTMGLTYAKFDRPWLHCPCRWDEIPAQL